MTDLTNPPGQPSLRRRVLDHPGALAAMRDVLGDPTRPAALRGLAGQETTDPVPALLDAWAVVCDVVAFYTERIANEGYLRTATERYSVRALARTLGHELRPGVAAQVELAFRASTAIGAPEVVTVPAGTPAQSIPGQGELPQVFQTSTELEARGVWNALPVVTRRAQDLDYGSVAIWLHAAASTLRNGDTVLVVGDERDAYGRRPGAGSAQGVTDGTPGREYWDVRTVVGVVAEPEGFPGWTRIDLDRPIGYRRTRPLTAQVNVRLFHLAQRFQMFGATAPDPNLLVSERHVPPGIEAYTLGGSTAYRWRGFEATTAAQPATIELDGDQRAVLADSWVVIDQPGLTEAYRVEDARPDGATRYGMSGKITRLRLDVAAELAGFDRRKALVHAVSVEIPAAVAPLPGPIEPGAVLHLHACDPLLPPGRLVIIEGTDAATGRPLTEVATVVSCAAGPPPGREGEAVPDQATMTVVVDPPLTGAYEPVGLLVHANVTHATHGETVAQVLGSGDGRSDFQTFAFRRGPLTHVRARTESGARAEVEIRVDGIRWEEVADLEQAGPNDRVHILRAEEAPGESEQVDAVGTTALGTGTGRTLVVLGDGAHGARAASGAENITATYRVGIGADGAVRAGQISLLMRRPLGIAEVTNPAPSHDWASPEAMSEARRTAPQRVRTLGRVVSVADHGDLARGYAGIAHARAEAVWDGRSEVVVLTVLAVDGHAPSDALLTDLRSTLDDVRVPGPLSLLPGCVQWFGVRLDLRHDSAHVRADVECAVRERLHTALGVGERELAMPVTSAAVLVLVHEVPGVVACSMPRLLPLGRSRPPAPGGVVSLPSDEVAKDRLEAHGARWDGGLLAAEIQALPVGGVDIRELAPDTPGGMGL